MQQITIDLTTIFTSAGTYSVTSQAHDSTGAFRDSDNSTAVSFKVAAAPSISVHPQNASYSAGGTATALSVTASVGDGGTLSYKWQKSTDSGTSYSDISGATSSTYTPDVSTASTYMYRCIVTNTLDATIASTTSNAATITVTAAGYILSYSASATVIGTNLTMTLGGSEEIERELTSDGASKTGAFTTPITTSILLEIDFNFLDTNTVVVMLGATELVNDMFGSGSAEQVYSDYITLTGNTTLTITVT